MSDESARSSAQSFQEQSLSTLVSRLHSCCSVEDLIFAISFLVFNDVNSAIKVAFYLFCQGFYICNIFYVFQQCAVFKFQTMTENITDKDNDRYQGPKMCCIFSVNTFFCIRFPRCVAHMITFAGLVPSRPVRRRQKRMTRK